MRCEDVRARLPRMNDEPSDLGIQRHLDACEGCRTETERYRAMLHTLAEMRGVQEPAPDGLFEDTLAAIGGSSVIRVMNGRQKAAVAGAVGAVAAGAAATAVVLARRRGLRLAAVLAR